MADPLSGGDHETLAFLQNASNYINTNAAVLGVPTARATLLLSQTASFGTNLTAHDVAQSTSRSACAAKDAVRDTVDQTAREIFATLRSNTAVTNAQLEAIGLNPRDNSRSPIAAPTVMPAMVIVQERRGEVTFRAVDSADPLRRAKPVGVANWQAFVKVSDVAPVTTADCALAKQSGKGLITLSFAGGDIGKLAWIMLRATNAKGEAGPACDPVQIRIAA